ncbi:MAG: cardiolipin synthase [Novosphingobium sp.]|nr:cardiolipin synthase [Novosphingobium sp.]
MIVLPHSDWALAYFIFEWVLRIAFVIVVLPKRQPAAARIWLLFGFLAPVPAAVAYALFGRMRNPRRRQQREERAARAQEEWIALHADPNAPATPLARFVDEIGGYPPVAGNQIEVMPEYDRAVDAIIEAIENAEKRVFLMTYIFGTGPVGERIIAALARAVDRGVECHVMFDALGSRPWRKRVLEALRIANVPARAANQYNPFRGGTGRLDRRNHRKIYVVDDRIAFTGSQNLIARDFRPGIVNFELLLKIEGPLAADLAAQFVIDWRCDGGEPLRWPDARRPLQGDVSAQVLASGPELEAEAYPLLLSRVIQEADKSLLIVSPYTVLDEGLRLALVTAAMRGVDVTLLVSAVVDHPLVRLAQEASYGTYLASGITIRLFEPGLLHAKYVIADDSRAIIGTSNADIRSFQINSEVSLVSEDPDLLDKLRVVASDHLSQSKSLSSEEWHNRPTRRRIAQKLAALASPLL